MMTWQLDVETRGGRLARAVDRDALIVGRGTECDLQVPDPRVSRQHCRFLRKGAELVVEDLGSRGGTRMNGRAITTPAVVHDGDRLELSEESVIVVHAKDTRPVSTTRSTATSGETIFREADSFLAKAREITATTPAAELRRYAERLKLLNEVHQALGSSPRRDELLELILDRVFRHLQPEQATVQLLDEAGEPVHIVTRPEKLRAGELFVSHSLVQEVVGNRLAALVLDAPTDERFAQAVSFLSSGVKSLLAAPLLAPDRVIGLIVLSSRLHVRQFAEADMELLVSLAAVAALHLRNVDLAEQAAERRRLEQEMALARRIQLALLPAHLPEIPGYGLQAGNIPSRHVSGDLYTVAIHPESGAVTCLVADVSGKGMAASLLGASLEALAAGPIEVGHTPDDICERVSRRLFVRTPPEKYATAFVIQLDPATHTLRYTNAGHNPAILVRAGGSVETLAASGPPLGLMAAASYQARSIELATGDVLLVYTDGLTEANDPDDEEFGLQRLIDVTRSHASKSLGEIRDGIEDALDEFARGVPFADDRTLLLLRREA
jgi:sigma-B regulation protein RsbU (phosphoserine phosphatase)